MRERPRLPRLAAQMQVIRLQRTGRKNLPSYRIVAAEKARPVKGKFLEILGHYLPALKTPEIKIDTERVTALISKGAIPSNTVARLLQKQGMKGMEKYMDRYTKKRSKNAPEEVAAPAAPAAEAPAPAAEAPVAEAAPAADDNAEKKE